MKKFILAGFLALAVLGLRQATASAQHFGKCRTGHCGHGHCGGPWSNNISSPFGCIKCAPCPIEFPLPPLTIPIPKIKVFCACPPDSWGAGAGSAWYNYWPPGPGTGMPSTPYYWNGR